MQACLIFRRGTRRCRLIRTRCFLLRRRRDGGSEVENPSVAEDMLPLGTARLKVVPSRAHPDFAANQAGQLAVRSRDVATETAPLDVASGMSALKTPESAPAATPT